MMSRSLTKSMYTVSLPDSKNYFLLFVIWPFLAFLTALTNFEREEAKKVVYLFLIYFGFSFFIPQEGYVDAAGYAMQLKTNASLPFTDFFKIITGFNTNETSLDIIEPLISFIVSRFTTEHYLLFAVYASVFGFFYLKSIDLLYSRFIKNPGWNNGIHLAFFSLVLTITAINGFRMWTAAWIYFYGAYHVVLHKNAKYLLVAAAACLVHWSFLSVNVVLLIYYLIGNKNFIYIPVTIISFFVPSMIAPFLTTISLQLGGALQSRYESYSSEIYIATRQGIMEEASWFLQLGDVLVFYYFVIAIIYIRISAGKIMANKPEQNLFSFLLLFVSFVNFGIDIPSFGSRFRLIFFLLGALYIFLYFTKLPGNRVHFITLLGLAPMAIKIMVAFRKGSESINAWLMAPGIGLPFLTPPISLTELLFP